VVTLDQLVHERVGSIGVELFVDPTRSALRPWSSPGRGVRAASISSGLAGTFRRFDSSQAHQTRCYVSSSKL
jgi:hypothetical protein